MLTIKNKKQRTKTLTIIFGLFVLLFVVFVLGGSPASAQVDWGMNYATNVGLGTTEVRDAAVNVIRTILGILAILALGIIIYAGVVWMTSNGNEERIALAKKIILNALIGLIIIMMAYGIVSFVINLIGGSTSGDNNNSSQCVLDEVRGKCWMCKYDALSGKNVWRWQIDWPECDTYNPTTSLALIDVNTNHAGDTDKDDVYTCSKVQNIFNKNIKPESNSLGGLSVDPSQSGSWSVRGNALTFTPTGNEFSVTNTSCSEHLPTDIKSTSDYPLSSCSLSVGCEGTPPPDYKWNFYVGSEGDETAPSIVSTYPRSDGNMDYNVPVKPIIRVKFSEGIDATDIIDIDGGLQPTNIQIYEIDDMGNNVQLSRDMFDIKIDTGNSFIFWLNGANKLKPFTEHKIVISNMRDLCGNVMDPATYTWNFATNDKEPGISSVYPTGDNVCPDSDISFSFNTSMYTASVTLELSSVSDNFRYTLPAGESRLAGPHGEFVVIDDSDPSTGYRVYEFHFNSDLEENVEYEAHIVTDYVIDVDNNTIYGEWIFGVTDLEDCVCSPYISHLSKDQGPVGDCLTIRGKCFAGTQSSPASVSGVFFDDKSADIGSSGDPRYIGTSVPKSFTEGDRPEISVEIDYADGDNSVPRSNTRDFYITPGEANGPCLWSVSPSSAERQSSVSFSGLRLGESSSLRNVIFSPDATESVEADNWTDKSIFDVVVPITAIDGDVYVVNDAGSSNTIPFDVMYCGDGDVSRGEECDGSNFDGKTCMSYGFSGGDLSCTVNCSINKDDCSNAPRVVEKSSCEMACVGGSKNGQACYNDSNCDPNNGGVCNIIAGGLPNPNPYKNSDEVCRNAVLFVDLAVPLDLTTINDSNVYINKCADVECSTDDIDPSATVPVSINVVGEKSLEIVPAVSLERSSSYIVSLSQNIKSEDGINMEDDYSWSFQTSDTDYDCEIKKTRVYPASNIMGAIDVYSYRAQAIAEAECAILNSSSYDWVWGIDDANNPSIGVSVSESAIDDTNATVNSGTTPGRVYVTTETDNKIGRSRLDVVIDSCAFDPGICARNCPGSVCDKEADRCVPVINDISPNNGALGNWVTIHGCYFGNRAGEVIFGGGVKGNNLPDYCGDNWSDSEIVVSVPGNTTPSDTSDDAITGAIEVITTDGMSTTSADAFTVNSDLHPGLCRLRPDDGKFGDNINLLGFGFGDSYEPGLGDSVVYYSGQTANISDWSGNSIYSEVPEMAESGNIFVSNAGDLSNPLYFDVSYTPLRIIHNKECKKACANDISRKCDVDIDCMSGMCMVNSLPSPYPSSGEKEVCLNASVYIRFNKELDPASVRDGSVLLYECGNEKCNNPELVDTNISISGSNAIVLRPVNDLEGNSTWHKVVVKSGVDGVYTFANPIIQYLNKDSSWNFRTTNLSGTEGVCSVDSAFVAPPNAVIDINSTQHYTAEAINSACVILDPTDYVWNWESTNVSLVSLNNTQDHTNVAMSHQDEGSTYIKSMTEGISGYSKLVVSSDKCADPNQDGIEECPGSYRNPENLECQPVITSVSPEVGEIGRAVTVLGCHFKNKTSDSKVIFDNTEVVDFPCNNSWRDKEIIVNVPDGLSSNPDHEVRVLDKNLVSSNAVNFTTSDRCVAGLSAYGAGNHPLACSLEPNKGRQSISFGIAGQNFGENQGEIKFGDSGVEIKENSWTDSSVVSRVPGTANTAPVVVYDENGCPSNGLLFEVDIPLGVGYPCDDNTATETCDIDANNICPSFDADLACSAVDNCTCQPTPIDLSVLPSGNNVCRNAVASVVFSRPMRDSTLGPANIGIYQISDTNITGSCEKVTFTTTEAGKEDILSRLVSWFKGVLGIVSAEAESTEYRCFVVSSTEIINIPSGMEGCTNEKGCTKVVVSPRNLLEPETDYELDINSTFGHLGASISSMSAFTTGAEVCDIENVKVNIQFTSENTLPVTRKNVNYDHFTCAKSNCSDDVDSGIAGNQHKYLAQAYDAYNTPLMADYLWKKADIDNVIALESEFGQAINVTNSYVNGDAYITVEASDPIDDNIDLGWSSSSVIVYNNICQNTWPVIDDYPFQDRANNCDDNGKCDYDMTFSLHYCRDRGFMEDYCVSGSNVGATCDCPDGSCNLATQVCDGGSRDGFACCDGGTCLSSTYDDLPALSAPPIIRGQKTGVCIGGSNHGASCSDADPALDNCIGGYCNDLLKEYFFGFDSIEAGKCSNSPKVCYSDTDCEASTCVLNSTTNRRCTGDLLPCYSDADCSTGNTCEGYSDAIGLRIYRNSEHLSPGAWYEKYTPNPGNYSAIDDIDGYPAVKDSNTTYVSFSIDTDPEGSHNIFNNLYVLSRTSDSNQVTAGIYNQILNNTRFNINGIDDKKLCSNSAGELTNVYCDKDSDCTIDYPVCDNKKTKLVRDSIRIGHLSEIAYRLDKYRGHCSAHSNLACVDDSDCPGVDGACITAHDSYPLLSDGTYVAGQSVSVWGSWQDTFANELRDGVLLVDPVNLAGNCPDGYNSECWDETSRSFVCSAGSNMYHYVTGGKCPDDGYKDCFSSNDCDSGQCIADSYSLYMNMEYSPTGWNPAQTGLFAGSSVVQPQCAPPGTNVYNLQYQK